jgi:hypothetical protein
MKKLLVTSVMLGALMTSAQALDVGQTVTFNLPQSSCTNVEDAVNLQIVEDRYGLEFAERLVSQLPHSNARSCSFLSAGSKMRVLDKQKMQNEMYTRFCLQSVNGYTVPGEKPNCLWVYMEDVR